MRSYKNRSKARPSEAKYWYDGSTHAANMAPDARRAYNSWRDQRHRCRNKKLECYKYYGGKGVEVRYSAREFVGWWLEELKSFGGDRPTISRIDHDGHYEFGNVKLEDHKENCVVDTLSRCGAPGSKTKKKILILDGASLEPLVVAESTIEAGVLCGVARTNISSILSSGKTNRTLNGYAFRYAESGLK